MKFGPGRVLGFIPIAAGFLVNRADRKANHLRLIQKLEKYRRSYGEYGAIGLPPIRNKETEEIERILSHLPSRDIYNLEKILEPLHGDTAALTYIPRILSEIVDAELQVLDHMKKNLLIMRLPKNDRALMETASEVGRLLLPSYHANYLLQAHRNDMSEQISRRLRQLSAEILRKIESPVELALEKLTVPEDLTPNRSAQPIGEIMSILLSVLSEDTKCTLGYKST